MIARLAATELEQRFVALLMPMQHDNLKQRLPDWLMPKAEPTAAEQPATPAEA